MKTRVDVQVVKSVKGNQYIVAGLPKQMIGKKFEVGRAHGNIVLNEVKNHCGRHRWGVSKCERYNSTEYGRIRISTDQPLRAGYHDMDWSYGDLGIHAVVTRESNSAVGFERKRVARGTKKPKVVVNNGPVRKVRKDKGVKRGARKLTVWGRVKRALFG